MDIPSGVELKNQVEFCGIFLLKTATESRHGKYQKSVEKVTQPTSHAHAELWKWDYNFSGN